MNVKIYKYKTHGIYEWGRGFLNGEIADKWHKFWDYVATNGQTPASAGTNRSISLWRILPGDIGCDILVNTGGSIYLHPMDGCGVIQTAVKVSHDGVYAELCRLMNECVEFIGNCASVEMYSSKTITLKE